MQKNSKNWQSVIFSQNINNDKKRSIKSKRFSHETCVILSLFLDFCIRDPFYECVVPLKLVRWCKSLISIHSISLIIFVILFSHFKDLLYCIHSGILIFLISHKNKIQMYKAENSNENGMMLIISYVLNRSRRLKNYVPECVGYICKFYQYFIANSHWNF